MCPQMKMNPTQAAYTGLSSLAGADDSTAKSYGAFTVFLDFKGQNTIPLQSIPMKLFDR